MKITLDINNGALVFSQVAKSYLTDAVPSEALARVLEGFSGAMERSNWQVSDRAFIERALLLPLANLLESVCDAEDREWGGEATSPRALAQATKVALAPDPCPLCGEDRNHPSQRIRGGHACAR